MQAKELKSVLNKMSKIQSEAKKSKVSVVQNLEITGGAIISHSLDSILMLTGTDLSAGQVQVPYAKLKKLVSALKPTDQIDIREYDNEHTVGIFVNGKPKYRLVDETPEDMPKIPVNDFKKAGEITATDLMRMVSLKPVLDSSGIKPAMACVNYGANNIVGCDGHALVWLPTSGNWELEENETINITPIGVDLMDAVGPGELFYNGLWVRLEGVKDADTGQQWKMFSRSEESAYPHWQAVIPENVGNSVMVDLDELENQLNLAVLAAEHTRTVTLYVREDQLVVYANTVSEETGKITEMYEDVLSGVTTLENKVGVYTCLDHKLVTILIKIIRASWPGEDMARIQIPGNRRPVVINERTLLMPILFAEGHTRVERVAKEIADNLAKLKNVK